MDIILSDFMSLDGVVQAPGGPEEDTDGGFAHGGWSMPYFDVDVMGPAIDAVMEGTDAMVFGRRTWQAMAAAWPSRAGDPFADKINVVTKYVASTTLTQDDLTWEGSELIEGDPVELVRGLREQEGGNVQCWGSASVARALVEADLVDEYRLLIEPILLGGGKRVFPETGQARPLELVEVEKAGTGVLVCTYRRVR